MPITFTFDLDQNTDPNDRTRINLAFRRLGWENIGGSAWRYPKFQPRANNHSPEDWFNHVIPALMYFRSIVENKGITVTNFTIDAHSVAGYRGRGTGNISRGNKIKMCNPGIDGRKLSSKVLREFVEGCANSI